MNSSTHVRRGLIDKRHSILTAALTVFGREGYIGSSIESISTVAGVSTRTVYNHFEDKADLFQTTIHSSATEVADAQLELIDRHLGALPADTDTEAVLVAFAIEWVATVSKFSDHFALVRLLPTEAAHLPRSAIDAWLRTGPLRVRRELAHHFRRLASIGLLALDDADTAAQHFSVLTATAIPPFYCHIAPSEEDVRKAVLASVRAFLYGYCS